MFAKKLQFNEDVKEFKDMRLQEHIGKKNQEQLDYQYQQINYVNNNASSKKRGINTSVSTARCAPRRETYSS